MGFILTVNRNNLPPPPPSEKPQPSESHSSQFSESESFGNRGDNRPTVNLIADESPNSKFFARVKVITDTVATIAGVALTVTGLILMAPVSVFSAATLSAISTGSFYVGTALTIYSVGSSLHSISVKVNRDESIATEVLTLLSAFFSFYTQQVSQTMVAGAHAGKTYEEAIKGLKYMRLQEKLFPYIKLITAFSSIAGLCTSFYQLWHKKERTIHDYFQFSVLLFMTANTLTKPITLKGIFESQQIKYLKNMKNELTESESKNEFDKMLEVHDTSDEKAYMIRNLNQIENKNEFFELINRNGSFVRCTADGLNIDHEIDLHPKAYNAIGKDVINSKINVIEQTTKAALKKSLKSVAGIDLTENSEVDTLLEKIVNGPIEHREEAVKSLLQKYNIDQKSWDNAMNTFNKTLDDEVTRLITNMKSGASGEEQNLGRLKELGLKQIKGELSMDEKKEMNGVIEKCSFNRKNQFFETTADRRMMMDEYESKISGGKNVEQYRADLRELDRKKDSITENSYNIQKEDINNKLEAAKMAREFREKIDANFAINKSSIRKCKTTTKL
uniref:DUF4781 domain-containing protein n=1 Tax=Panagrolaimus superbus TaxID=310955 RepID=A0A914Y6M5_9BILA